MATPTDEESWFLADNVDVLQNHQIFRLLSNGRKEKDGHDGNSKARSLLALLGNDLFAWHERDSCVLTANLINMRSNNRNFQKLVCNNPPYFHVDQLLCSPDGRYLALIGRRGVSVMELPRRWGKLATFENAKAEILCRVQPICERFLVCSTDVEVLQTRWHPGGASNDPLIVILTSDSYLRMYSLRCAQVPEQVLQVGDSCTNVSMSAAGRGVTSVKACLGETPQAFDFGPPQRHTGKTKMGVVVPSLIGANSEEETWWPIFVVYGNGEVYMIVSRMPRIAGSKQPSLIGPLKMHPAADDNYGVDACAICCLATVPPVIVVATTAGTLYHCVVLGGDDGDEDGDEGREAPTLYVYESLELELALKMPDVNQKGITSHPAATAADEFTSLIRIVKDLSCPSRYHCSHGAGVHSVLVPWLQQLQILADADDVSSLAQLYSLDQQSIVEHLICTKPFQSSAASNGVAGLVVSSQPPFLNSLICLLANSFECILLQLASPYVTPSLPLLSDNLPKSSKVTTTAAAGVEEEPFLTQIHHVLARTTSNPMLRCGSDASGEMSGQQCFQLFSRATHVLREEYIHKLQRAKQLVQQRVELLRNIKDVQFRELSKFSSIQEELVDGACKMADKMEDVKEKQEELLLRVETVVGKVERLNPVISDAERQTCLELKELQEKVSDLRASLGQAMKKYDYQRDKISVKDKDNRTNNVGVTLSPSQSKQVRGILMNESSQIKSLVDRVKELQLKIDPI